MVERFLILLLIKNMDEDAKKYLYHSNEAKRHEAAARKHRERMMRAIEKQGGAPLELAGCTVRVVNMTRVHMTKKDTPPDVWEKYAIITAFKMLRISPQKKMNLLI